MRPRAHSDSFAGAACVCPVLVARSAVYTTQHKQHMHREAASCDILVALMKLGTNHSRRPDAIIGEWLDGREVRKGSYPDRDQLLAEHATGNHHSESNFMSFLPKEVLSQPCPSSLFSEYAIRFLLVITGGLRVLRCTQRV